MAFRKYGGLTYSATNNIVHNSVSNSNNLTISNKMGLLNSKIVSDSHLDINNDSIINIGSLIFSDGSVQTTAYTGGSSGQQGVTGPQGPDGNTGPQGPIGDTGPQGPIGDTGPQGSIGDTGPQGPIGDTGPQGLIGDTGAQGQTGQQGPQGADGNPGQDGTNIDYSTFGQNWIATTIANNLYAIGGFAFSSSGQYQTACMNGGGIYLSNNYGSSWTGPYGPSGSMVGWRSVSVSSSSQYQLACSDSASGINMVLSSDYGYTWTPGPVQSISSSLSSSGQYQSVVVNNTLSSGGIYISSNYGINWSQILSVTPTLYWQSIAISETGQYQIAGATGDYIYLSNDYGVNWSITSAPMAQWYSVAISSTGQYQSACSNGSGGIYYSNNYGLTWIISNASTSLNWYGIAMSSSGQYQTAVYKTGLLIGQIYYSTTYGSTWSLSSAISYPWYGISMSSTGQYQVAYTANGVIPYSSNLPLLFGCNITTYGTVTAAAFVATSDYRIKENTMMIEDTVDGLRPLQYFNTITQKTDFGFLAHEVQELFPFLVEGEKDGSANQSLNYLSLIALLVKEIQDIKKNNSVLEKKIKLLENKL